MNPKETLSQVNNRPIVKMLTYLYENKNSRPTAAERRAVAPNVSAGANWEFVQIFVQYFATIKKVMVENNKSRVNWFTAALICFMMMLLNL